MLCCFSVILPMLQNIKQMKCMMHLSLALGKLLWHTNTQIQLRGDVTGISIALELMHHIMLFSLFHYIIFHNDIPEGVLFFIQVESYKNLVTITPVSHSYVIFLIKQV